MSARRLLPCLIAVASLIAAAPAPAAPLRINEFKLSSATLAKLRGRMVDRLLATHKAHTWAPIPSKLTDADLKLMGLPPKRFLIGHRFRVPTAVYPDGHMVRLANKSGGKGARAGTPATATFAGTGFFGLRPGGWLLTVTDDEVGWCSMAHVYGTPGAYQISTAGHCGKAGDVGTVIGAVGNHTVDGVTVPVLYDFGKYSRSTGDAGIGKDWALISIDSAAQGLVTPTMAFWGGPFGIYRATGDVVSANLVKGSVSANPNPTLV